MREPMQSMRKKTIFFVSIFYSHYHHGESLAQKKSIFFLRECAAAGKTDSLILENLDVFRSRAEDAARNVLGEKDVIPFHENLNGIVVLNIHFAAHLFGNNDAAKLVNMSDYTGCFHRKKVLSCDLFCSSIVANFSTDVKRKFEIFTIFMEFFGRKFDKGDCNE
jgi:hypothetical protein